MKLMTTRVTVWSVPRNDVKFIRLQSRSESSSSGERRREMFDTTETGNRIPFMMKNIAR